MDFVLSAIDSAKPNPINIRKRIYFFTITSSLCNQSPPI